MRFVKAKRLVLIIILLLIGTYYVEAQQLSPTEIMRRVSPAVVKISSYDQSGKYLSHGSGFLVTPDGMVVSNYHVIKGAHYVDVKIISGDVYGVMGVVDFDIRRDFVILKIRCYDLPVVELGNSNQVEIGNRVVAIGNPLGQDNSLTSGDISGIRTGTVIAGCTLFQTSAPIAPGSSGGPLINMNGQVIGITTSTIPEGQLLNFALPINYVRGVIEANTAVQYTLANIARAQAQRDEEELTRILSELFSLYEDPDNLFSMVYPRAWRVERFEGWEEGNTSFIKTTMMAPQDAYRAEINGYLSEGIRINFRFPPRDRVWVIDPDYANNYRSAILQSNPGFALTASEKANMGGQPVEIFSIVGQNENIPEPEKATFILITNENYILTIELVSPTSKLGGYENIYLALMKTFELSPDIRLN